MDKKYILPDSMYDIIKFATTVVLPALAVFYVGLAGIWGWPYADEVSRTIAVVYTFLCAVMGFTSYTAKPVDYTDDLWGD